MITTLTNGRLVHFAGNAVSFNSDNPEIQKAIETHFKHCSNTQGTIIAKYKITAAAQDGFSACVDDSDLFSNFNYETTLAYLMQDALTRLNGASTTELIFHAAALSHAGNAVILCGQSGSGKSSLTAWLTANGLRYMSDEVIALPLDDEKISGLCRSIVLKAGSAFIWKRWLENKKLDGLLQFKDNSVWIEPTLLNPDGIQVTAVPQILIFPRYIENASFEVKRLTPADALFRLLQTLVNARNFSDHGMTATARLARQVTAFSLTYSNIESASEWIQKTIMG